MLRNISGPDNHIEFSSPPDGLSMANHSQHCKSIYLCNRSFLVLLFSILFHKSAQTAELFRSNELWRMKKCMGQ